MATDQVLLDGLLAAMRLSSEPMVLSDPLQDDTPIVAANTAFAELTGYPEADIVGRNCRFLQGARTDRDTVRQMGDCLRAGQGCVQWLLNYRKNGSTFWNLLFISPVFSADGQVRYFFANQHDLSGEVPLDKAEVRMGAAHMASPVLTEFHALLEQIGRARGPATDHARALESTVAAARQVAVLSRDLAVGSPG